MIRSLLPPAPLGAGPAGLEVPVPLVGNDRRAEGQSRDPARTSRIHWRSVPRGVGNVTEVSTIEVTERIETPPDLVWDLICDPTAMAGFTEECIAMQWMEGSSQPAVGARFRGRNRSGWRRWSTSCTIVRYEPGREIAWDVAFGPLSVAHWGYRIEPGLRDGATVIRESFEDRRSSALRALGPLVRGTGDADGLNRVNMTTTLARIKLRAEA